MSRKKNSEESSLELLLDTMCNTFGGVMFIAIALVVLMSMMSNIASALQVPAEKLQTLEKELAILLQQNQVLDKALRRLENHPARKQISEFMTLQKELAAARIQEEIEKTQKALAEQNFLLQREIVKQDQSRLAKAKMRREKRENELKTQQDRLAKMRKPTEEASYSMTFRIMEQSSDHPYFLVVTEDRIWKVGPDAIPGTGELKVSGECTSETAVDNGQQIVICHPIPGKGIPILQGGQPSPEALALLAGIPEKRVPQFSLSRDSFRSFCILRDYMTKRKIRHGISLSFDRSKSFSYRVVSEQKSYWY